MAKVRKKKAKWPSMIYVYWQHDTDGSSWLNVTEDPATIPDGAKWADFATFAFAGKGRIRQTTETTVDSKDKKFLAQVKIRQK